MSGCLIVTANSAEKTLGLGILNESGEIEGWKTVPFEGVEGPNGPSPICLSPDLGTLYVAFRGTPPQVLTFRLDRAGPGLEQVGRAPLADSMAYIATDRSGRYLLSASYGGGIVSMNRISPSGLAGGIVSTLEAGPMAHCTVVSADNRQVYVPSVGAERISRFALDAGSGVLGPALDPAASFAPGTGPRHLVLSGGGFAYCVNQTNGTVDAFAMRADGGFDRVGTADITGPAELGAPLASDIHLTPDGRFLYASERTSDSITGFRVDPATGGLTRTCRIAVAKTPRGFAIDPAGRFLVALAEVEGTASVWAIDPDGGALEFRSTAEVGAGPNWVELLPLSR